MANGIAAGLISTEPAVSSQCICHTSFNTAMDAVTRGSRVMIEVVYKTLIDATVAQFTTLTIVHRK